MPPAYALLEGLEKEEKNTKRKRRHTPPHYTSTCAIRLLYLPFAQPFLRSIARNDAATSLDPRESIIACISLNQKRGPTRDCEVRVGSVTPQPTPAGSVFESS